MKTYSPNSNKLILVGSLLLSMSLSYAQDDIYYMPSKDKEEVKSNPIENAVLNVDTSGMTDYQKYRAMRDGEASVPASNDTIYAKPVESKSQDQEPAYAFSSSDTSSDGTVIVNNYYFDDYEAQNRSYRNLYFDYYDPFYWDYSPYFSMGFYGGGPYYGYSFGYGYYDPYYWGSPYSWYRPCYSGFYGYYGYYGGYYGGYYSYTHGYYDGYYSGEYNHIRSQMNTSGGGRRSMGQYTPRISSSQGFNNNVSIANSRRGSTFNNTNAVMQQNVAAGGSRRSASTMNSNVVASSRYNARTNMATTRPNVAPSARRSLEYYVPSYNRGNNTQNQTYNSAVTGSRRQNAYNTTSGTNSVVRTYNSNTSTPSRQNGEVSTPNPRRSSDSYTLPVRTQSVNTGTSDDGGSRRSTSSGSTYSGGNSGRSSGSSAPSNNSGGGGSRRR